VGGALLALDQTGVEAAVFDSFRANSGDCVGEQGLDSRQGLDGAPFVEGLFGESVCGCGAGSQGKSSKKIE
jgi:hypothetical protein